MFFIYSLVSSNKVVSVENLGLNPDCDSIKDYFHLDSHRIN